MAPPLCYLIWIDCGKWPASPAGHAGGDHHRRCRLRRLTLMPSGLHLIGMSAASAKASAWITGNATVTEHF